MRTAGNRSRSATRRRVRARVASAFRKLAHGVGATAAFAQAKAYFRSSGGMWAHALT
jgi:hypothetical protein